MFWTDWGKVPKIERADMDGHNRTVVVSKNLGWPNGLSIDHSTARIIWADARTEVGWKFIVVMRFLPKAITTIMPSILFDHVAICTFPIISICLPHFRILAAHSTLYFVFKLSPPISCPNHFICLCLTTIT